MIVFENVTKVYDPKVVALARTCRSTIDKGEFVFVVGASGSGKSTMMRLLLQGARADERADHRRRAASSGGSSARRCRCCGATSAASSRTSSCCRTGRAFENIAYALKVQGEGNRTVIRAKVPEVLNLVGLAHKSSSYPDELSGGEQQRVSIARAFVNHPPLLICDEPTGNLDPDTSVGIMQLLYRINRAGTTVLMATHDREMVDKMRRRVIALEHGQLVARRAPRRLRLVTCTSAARLFVTEALRSITSNLSTTIAAAMTVLIGMFLLGLFIALGSWVVSWTDHVKQEVLVKVFFEQDVKAKEVNAVRAQLDAMPEVNADRLRLPGGRARADEGAGPRPGREPHVATRFRRRSR